MKHYARLASLSCLLRGFRTLFSLIEAQDYIRHTLCFSRVSGWNIIAIKGMRIHSNSEYMPVIQI